MIVDYQHVDIFQNENLILKDVNFSIKEKEFVFLTGMVGTGKSTFLKSLYASADVKGDKTHVLDTDLSHIKPSHTPALRKRLGIVFQDFQLLPDRTVFKNLEFVLKATGWKKKEHIASRIKKVRQRVELTDKADNLPHELSGGEQQRIAIARAILNIPEMIIADEPTGNLDIITSKHIIDILKSIFDAGTTIIMSTHNLSLMEWVEEAKQYICQDGHLLPASTITTSGNN